MILFCVTISLTSMKGILFFENFDSPLNWISTKASNHTGVCTIEETFSPQGRPMEKAMVLKSRNAKHGVSYKFVDPITLKNKSLIIQYEFRAQHSFTCSGAYIKLFSDENFNPETLNEETPYSILFGPDRCGPNKSIKLIITTYDAIRGLYFKSTLKNMPSFPNDFLSHLYTLIIRPNGFFQILFDNTPIRRGYLQRDFDPPIEIKNLVNSELVDNGAKHEINEEYSTKVIEIKQPLAWDEAFYGEWMAPVIHHPKKNDCCSQVQAKILDTYSDFEMQINGIGFEIWTVNKELAFTNILISSNEMEVIEWNSQDFLIRHMKQFDEMELIVNGNGTSLVKQSAPMDKTKIIVSILFLVISIIVLRIGKKLISK